MGENPSTQGDAAAWHEVTEALNALGVSIGRAIGETAGEDEGRRRMRELSEGLAALANRLEDAAVLGADAPVIRRIDQAADEAVGSAREAGRSTLLAAARLGDEAAASAAEVSAVLGEAAQRIAPQVADALKAATERFRAADKEWDAKEPALPAEPAKPVAPPTLAEITGAIRARVTGTETSEHPASITGAFAAVIGDKVSTLVSGVADAVGAGREPDEPEPMESSIHEWLYPEGATEMALETDLELEPGLTVSLIPDEVAEPCEPLPRTLTLFDDESASEAKAPSGPARRSASEPVVEEKPDVEPGREPDMSATVAPVVTPDRLEAVRIAHERFVEERRIAEAAASAARARTRSERRRGVPARRPVPPSDDEATPW